MTAVGTSRHFAARRNLVAIGATADIDQAAPIKLRFMSTRPNPGGPARLGGREKELQRV